MTMKVIFIKIVVQQKVVAENAVLEKVVLKKVVPQKAVLEKVIMEKLVFEKAVLKKVVLEKAILEKIDLERVILEKTVLEKADLEKVILEKASFREGSYEKDILKEEDTRKNISFEVDCIIKNSAKQQGSESIGLEKSDSENNTLIENCLVRDNLRDTNGTQCFGNKNPREEGLKKENSQDKYYREEISIEQDEKVFGEISKRLGISLLSNEDNKTQ